MTTASLSEIPVASATTENTGGTPKPSFVEPRLAFVEPRLVPCGDLREVTASFVGDQSLP